MGGVEQFSGFAGELLAPVEALVEGEFFATGSERRDGHRCFVGAGHELPHGSDGGEQFGAADGQEHVLVGEAFGHQLAGERLIPHFDGEDGQPVGPDLAIGPQDGGGLAVGGGDAQQDGLKFLFAGAEQAVHVVGFLDDFGAGHGQFDLLG